MKICFRTWGFEQDDWACSMHPTSDWRTVDEIEFKRKKYEFFKYEGSQKSRVLQIECTPNVTKKQNYLNQKRNGGGLEVRQKDEKWLISLRDKYSDKPFNEQACLYLYEMGKKLDDIEQEFKERRKEPPNLKEANCCLNCEHYHTNAYCMIYPSSDFVYDCKICDDFEEKKK